MVAPGPLERLLFAFVAPLRAEQARPLADERVAVDDAPVARLRTTQTRDGGGCFFDVDSNSIAHPLITRS